MEIAELKAGQVLGEFKEVVKSFKFPPTLNKINGCLRHKMARGTSLAWIIYENTRVHISRWFASAGCEFPEHKHKVGEWLITLEGEMRLTYTEQNEDKVLSSGVGIFHPPGVCHKAQFPMDTWYLVITVPPDKEMFSPENYYHDGHT